MEEKTWLDLALRAMIESHSAEIEELREGLRAVTIAKDRQLAELRAECDGRCRVLERLILEIAGDAPRIQRERSVESGMKMRLF